jgi:hypothetical protein
LISRARAAAMKAAPEATIWKKRMFGLGGLLIRWVLS